MTVVSFSDYLRKTYGERVQRISLHAGFTCPNRDGTVGLDGCTYCDNGSFHPGLGDSSDIQIQMQTGMSRAKALYKAKKYLAYFQTFSNTFAPVATLQKLYSQAIAFENVVGLMIGTRPDCLSPETIELLQHFNERLPVWIELGLQSAHDSTLKSINRGHDHRCSEEAVRNLLKAGIKVAAHVILGLPGEDRSMMMDTARWLNELGVQGVKIHHLHAVKNTVLAKLYESGNWQPLTVEEYIDLVVEFLLLLPSGTVVMRLVGDCPREMLLAPHWELSKSQIQQRIWTKYNDRKSRKI